MPHTNSRWHGKIHGEEQRQRFLSPVSNAIAKSMSFPFDMALRRVSNLASSAIYVPHSAFPFLFSFALSGNSWVIQRDYLFLDCRYSRNEGVARSATAKRVISFAPWKKEMRTIDKDTVAIKTFSTDIAPTDDNFNYIIFIRIWLRRKFLKSLRLQKNLLNSINPRSRHRIKIGIFSSHPIYKIGSIPYIWIKHIISRIFRTYATP